MTRKLNTHGTLAAIFALLLWSLWSNFVKFFTTYLDMWTQNLLRYSAACIFWFPFLVFSIRAKKLDASVWRKALVPSIFNIILQSLWAGAFYYLDPAFVALLVKSSIVWTAGFSMVFFVEERVLLKSKSFYRILSNLQWYTFRGSEQIGIEIISPWPSSERNIQS